MLSQYFLLKTFFDDSGLWKIPDAIFMSVVLNLKISDQWKCRFNFYLFVFSSYYMILSWFFFSRTSPDILFRACMIYYY